MSVILPGCEGSLNTTFAGQMFSYGNMFDVQTLRSKVIITGMDLHIRDVFGVRFNVYTKTGSLLDVDFGDPNVWTLHMRGAMGSKGMGQPTPIPDWIPVEMEPDSVRAWYVTLSSPDLLYSASNLSLDTGFVHDEELEIFAGVGVGSFSLASDPDLFRSRIWNGRLEYLVVSDDCSAHDTTFPTISPTTITEREALEIFYLETDGLFWNKSDGWLGGDVDICEWYGIRCNFEGTVVDISLQDNNVGGSSSEALFYLSSLESVRLDKNPIEFSFQGIEWAPSLRYISLTDTKTKSVEGIRNARQLDALILKNSSLTGTLSEELFEIETLEVLQMGFNALTGTVSSWIGRLRNLRFLSLENCQISGTIPEEISRLAWLRYFDLSHNRLSGMIPNGINYLTGLQTLYLQSQYLSGLLPSLEYAFTLTTVDLSSNKLVATIPEKFLDLRAVSEPEEIVNVNLTSNLLTGTVPVTLLRFDRLNIALSDNRITELPDEFCEKQDWMNGNVAKYGCEAILCSAGTANVLGRAPPPCLSCPDTILPVFLGATSCSGDNSTFPSTPPTATIPVLPTSSPAPPTVALPIGATFPTVASLSERQILEVFFQSTGGSSSWKNTYGWTLQMIPVCEWYGIVCGGDGKMLAITLDNNGLVGTTPPELFQLQSLELLSVNKNDLEFSFYGIEAAASLHSIQVSSTLTRSIDFIAGAQQLTGLFLDDTLVTGAAMLELSEIPTLEFLKLDYTRIGGAFLSLMVEKLPNLRYFSAPATGITGTIPTGIEKLSWLEYLDISKNVLVGTIPDQINNLLQLGTLYLNSMNLAGTLPEFDDLSRLTDLDVSDNRLSGTLPSRLLKAVQNPGWWVRVDLSSNMLTGTLPASLTRFGKLNIDLAANQINTLPLELCQKTEWMDGHVAEYGCEAILCPAGTANVLGRAPPPCEPCPDTILSDFLGSTSCNGNDSLPTTAAALPTSSPAPSTVGLPIGTAFPTAASLAERQILNIFFRSTGGPASWKDVRGWTVESAPLCERFGIVCDDDGELRAIALDSNGLVGTTPQEIFQLQSLERLSLNKNDIEFSFYGIEVAASLRSIQVSSTMTRSVAGIAGARQLASLFLDDTLVTGSTMRELFELSSLEFLKLGSIKIGWDFLSVLVEALTNLRYLSAPASGITGTIPSGIDRLRWLGHLDISQNELFGTIPDEINSLGLLESLNLRSMNLTGTLPAFDSLSRLTDLDVSDNLLIGAVPARLLEAVEDPRWRVKVDLSSNMLIGTVPETLSRIERLDIDLTGNKITTLPVELCQKTEWMDGDVAAFGCFAIMCPPGTYNEIGRQNSSDMGCLACPNVSAAEYFGSSTCAPSGADNTYSKDQNNDDDEFFQNDTTSWSNDDPAEPPGQNINDEKCFDDLTCENGGKCVESSEASGVFFCNCSTASFGGVPYAGKTCEHAATSLCVIGGPPYDSFCTNGGACNELVQQGQLHAGCSCPADFRGDSCQFLAAGIVRAAIGPSGDDSSSLKPWGLAVALVLPVIAIALLLLLVRRRFFTAGHKMKAEERDVEASIEEPLSEGGEEERTIPKDGDETHFDGESDSRHDFKATWFQIEEEKIEIGSEDNELPQVYGEIAATGGEHSSSASEDDHKGDEDHNSKDQ